MWIISSDSLSSVCPCVHVYAWILNEWRILHTWKVVNFRFESIQYIGPSTECDSCWCKWNSTIHETGKRKEGNYDAQKNKSKNKLHTKRIAVLSLSHTRYTIQCCIYAINDIDGIDERTYTYTDHKLTHPNFVYNNGIQRTYHRLRRYINIFIEALALLHTETTIF